MKPWFDSSLQGMQCNVKGISRSVAPIALEFQSMKTEKVIKKYQVPTDYKSNHPNNSNFILCCPIYQHLHSNMIRYSITLASTHKIRWRQEMGTLRSNILMNTHRIVRE